MANTLQVDDFQSYIHIFNSFEGFAVSIRHDPPVAQIMQFNGSPPKDGSSFCLHGWWTTIKIYVTLTSGQMLSSPLIEILVIPFTLWLFEGTLLTSFWQYNAVSTEMAKNTPC